MTRCTRCNGKAELFLCWRCTKSLCDNLDRALWLSRQLLITGSRRDRLGTRGVIGDSGDDSPILFTRSAAAAVERYDELRTTLMRWVRDICDQRAIEFVPLDFADVPVGPLKPGVQRLPARYIPSAADLAKWLLHHITAIASSEDAALFFTELDATVSRGVDAINRPAPAAYCGPCPTPTGNDERGRPTTCSEALYAERERRTGNVATHVTCWKCKQRHDVAALKQAIFARADHFLFTAAELFRVLDDLGEHLPRNRFYAWRNDQTIREAGWKHGDRIVDYRIYNNDPPVFRLGDVRRAAAEFEARQNGTKRPVGAPA